ncbi:hypothetical protein LT493_44230 [Streptomyces tricolor]|nr:hypothetical protein [Streptomyces tricolor]
MRLICSSQHFGDEDPVRIRSLLRGRADDEIIRYVLDQGVAGWPSRTSSGAATIWDCSPATACRCASARTARPADGRRAGGHADAGGDRHRRAGRAGDHGPAPRGPTGRRHRRNWT